MPELVYLSGSMVRREEARISAMDGGFLYGYGLFETVRAYGGRVFRLGRHLERLARSADALGIPVDPARLADAVMETLRANDLAEARVRLTVSGGGGSAALDEAPWTEPTVLVVATRYRPLPEDVYRRGFRAVMSSIRRNSQSPLPSMKCTSFLESLLARRQARVAGADEAVCLNERGLVAEASMSNIFVVKDGRLRTPGVDSGILPGVTREAVLEMAAGAGIGREEGDITAHELFAADEVFLTNSVMELMPLTELAGRPVGSGVRGAVTLRLMAAYRELVSRETGTPD